jgi:RNA polymerase sigma-70 factor (ECF subfamily)
MPTDEDAVCRALITDLPRLRARVRASVGDPHLAEDILQEIAIVVLKHRDRFTVGTSFQGWVTEIQRRVTWAECRRRRRVPLALADDQLDAITAAALAEDPWERERSALRACLDGMPADGRRALDLHHVHRLPLTEVAQRTGRSVDGVKALLKRLRARLHACIDHRLAGS